MSNFQPLLKSIYENLSVPQPQRSKIILEIAADMEDMYEHFLIRGMSEEEAMDKLESEFDFDEDTLAQLKSIHTPGYSRWMENLPKHTQNYWEKGVISILAIFILFVIFSVFSSEDFLVNSRPAIFVLIPFTTIGIFRYINLRMLKRWMNRR